jgi:transcriptional regulator GlxA family with amidase domain
MQIDIVVFNGFDEMDAIGPYEVFRNAGIDAAIVTHDGATTIIASHGLTITPQRTLGRPDAVLVPGGGWMDGNPEGIRKQIADGDLPKRLRELADDGVIMISVCTGAMLLAAAGITDGRPAITHAGAKEALRESGALVQDDARVVDDDDLITAGGVMSGIDLALHVVEREFGRVKATLVAQEMEHHRDERVRQLHG